MLYRLKPIFSPVEGIAPEQKLADLVPAILFVFDAASGRLTYLSNQACSILGYKSDELDAIKENILSIVHRSDISCFQKGACRWYELPEGKTSSFTCQLLSSTGEAWPFQVSGTVLHSDEEGNPVSFLCMAQEIDDDKSTPNENSELLHAMTESEKMLRSGTIRWDGDMGGMYFSPGMFALMGYHNESLASQMRVEFLYQHVRKEELPAVKKHIENASRNMTGDEFSFTMINAKNEELTIAASIKPFTHANGTAAMIGAFHDITLIKRMETDLETKIRELNRSNADLEEFAYVSSHDLQEPLRKITTFSERLESKFSEQLNDEGRMYLRRMGVATGNMRRLIDNLLDFSKLAKTNQSFISTDLNMVLHDVKGELELKLEESGTQLEVGPLPTVEAINSQVRQLFTNLISNAIKFAKPRQHPHIAITAKPLDKEAKQLHGLHPENNYYELNVQDDGIGFDPVYAERIFQLFQRLHGKEEYPGTGIGLAICKKIAENHGGIISAASTPDEGATFTIILPEKQ